MSLDPAFLHATVKTPATFGAPLAASGEGAVGIGLENQQFWLWSPCASHHGPAR